MTNTDNRPTIYVSSKRQHTELWRMYRFRGYRIISSWIDLEGGIDVETIGRVYWPRWLDEASSAEYVIFYAHPQDVNHASNLIEITACLLSGGTVLHVGVSDTMKTADGDMADFTYHERWHRLASLDTAFRMAASRTPAAEYLGLDPLSPD